MYQLFISLAFAFFGGNSSTVLADIDNFSTENIIIDNFKCIPNKKINFSVSPESSESQYYMSIISAWLSHERDPQKRARQLEKWGFEKSTDFGKDLHGHRGYVAVHDNFVAIAFRGTQTPNDYLSNAFFNQTEFDEDLSIKNAKIHNGMAGVYRSVLSELLSAVKSTSKDKPIFIFGHSLGGALGILFGYKLSIEGYNIRNILVAGTPKIGNQAIVDKIDELLGQKITHIGHHSDITPMVPPTKEASQNFSRIISDKMPALRMYFYNLIHNLNYSPNPGSHLVLSRTPESDYKLEPEPNIKQKEFNYWDQISSNLENREDISKLIKFMQSRFATHHPTNYICGLSQMIDQETE